jgi:hypothetical protein
MPSEKPKVLYVVLHGLISLVDEGSEGFTAYLLNMRKEHQYLAGDWLVEDKIPNGSQWTLHGVARHGKAKLDATMHPVLKAKPHASLVDSALVRGTFHLPRPNCIHYQSLGKLKPKSLQGDVSSLVRIPTFLSGARVFEYAFKNGDQVNLRYKKELLWQCIDPGESKYAVLHIYDQPGQRMPGSSHNQREFAHSAAFFGKNLQLTQNTTGGGHPPPRIPGLLDGELSCLHDRRDKVVAMLATLRLGEPVGNAHGGCGSETCAGCDGH